MNSFYFSFYYYYSYYEDGQENIFNEQVLKTITSQETYLNAKHPEKTSDESSAKKQPKSSNLSPPVKAYSDYSNFTWEIFIDCILEVLKSID
ncbi:hypothetical protein BDF14DRAFT_1974834 [Spinellus fusiger]|nr:hypothetical protein BDF14DRAFT_1974834 [Spinellus fusiger]